MSMQAKWSYIGDKNCSYVHSSKRDMLSARNTSLYEYGIQNCTICVRYKIPVWYRTYTLHTYTKGIKVVAIPTAIKMLN